tara:strand:+ start:625 stop:810 length:186 start_codon:yes stop_codon:yes gene_type:complete
MIPYHLIIGFIVVSAIFYNAEKNSIIRRQRDIINMKETEIARLKYSLEKRETEITTLQCNK